MRWLIRANRVDSTAPKREAIALELAAEYARARGEADRASKLQSEAAAAYGRWGAVAKMNALAEALRNR